MVVLVLFLRELTLELVLLKSTLPLLMELRLQLTWEQAAVQTGIATVTITPGASLGLVIALGA